MRISIRESFKPWARLLAVFGLLGLGRGVAAPGGLDLDLGRLQFDWFEESERFASIAVVDVVQDRLGFVWVGTRDGIYRYDGTRFLSYRQGARERRQLPNNRVLDLLVDSRGKLWAAFEQGAASYDAELDRFLPCELEVAGSRVLGFAETKGGEIVLLGEGLGLCKQDDSGVFRPFGPSLIERPSCLVGDEELGLIVGGSEGFQIVDGAFSGTRTYRKESSFIEDRDTFVRAVARVSEGEVWVGTNNAGLWILDLETGAFRNLPSADMDEDSVGSILVDAKGDVLVGTTAGLTVFSAEGVRKRSYRNERYNAFSIQPGTVYGLDSDRQGNLWVGTSRGGLSVVRNAKAFGGVDDNAAVPLSKRKVTAVILDSRNRLWVGYHNDGIDVVDLREGAKRFLDSHVEGAESPGRGTVWEIIETSDGSIWVGTSRDGLSVLEPGASEFRRFDPAEEGQNGIQGYDVRVALPDADENLWLAVHGRGVDFYDRASGAFKNYHNPTGEWIEDLALDGEGNLWVASSEGLSVLKKGSDELVAFEDPADPFSQLLCLYVDSGDTLWIGSRNGLRAIGPRREKVVHYGWADGLPGDSIRSIVESADGGIWVATSEGLGRFDRESGSFAAFHKHDGLLSDQFVERASFRAADGTLFFGSEKGVVAFRPEEIQLNSIPPEVVITGMSMGNVLQDSYGEPDSLLPQTTFTAEQIVLPPGNGNFGFQFAALDFVSAGMNAFEYQLVGFDENWVSNGTRTDCYYTNIPPGDYVFRVRASNADGVWNEAGVALPVRLEAYFWQTAWFKVALVSSLLLAVMLGMRWRLASLARQKQVLVETVAERTSELSGALKELGVQKAQIEEQNLELIDHRENLEKMILRRTSELQVAKEKAEESDRLKSAFLENISHEIRTPMNAIIGFANVLHDGDCEEEEWAEYLEIIEESGYELTSMIDNVIELSLLESQKLELYPQPTRLQEFFEKWTAELRDELSKKGKSKVEANLEVSSELGTDFIAYIDCGRLDRVVGLLLENAVKFTDVGMVTLSCKLSSSDAGGLLLEVEDTGVGIPAEKVDSIFDVFSKVTGDKSRLYRGSGLGLAIAKRLVTLMKGEISVESEVGRGTRFSVRVPFSDELCRLS